MAMPRFMLEGAISELRLCSVFWCKRAAAPDKKKCESCLEANRKAVHEMRDRKRKAGLKQVDKAPVRHPELKGKKVRCAKSIHCGNFVDQPERYVNCVRCRRTEVRWRTVKTLERAVQNRARGFT